jgi:hypothetical protein
MYSKFRYLFFGFNNYYPEGGFKDFLFGFNTIEDFSINLNKLSLELEYNCGSHLEEFYLVDLLNYSNTHVGSFSDNISYNERNLYIQNIKNELIKRIGKYLYNI